MSASTLTMVALMLLAMAAYGRAEPTEAVDPAEVARQIQATGVRDDVKQTHNAAAGWLRDRRQQVVPQLAAALSDPNPRVAEACLDILRVGPADPRMLPQLLVIASDTKNSLSKKATFALTPYGVDRQAHDLMAAAAADKERFPDGRHRARLAAAARQTDLAISLLSAVVANRQLSSDRAEAVRQLEEIGQPAIPALETASKIPDWDAARSSLLALDRLDEMRHGLTADQRQFLKDAGRGFKTTEKVDEQRQQAMSKLDRQQIRPFVMQALASDGYQANRDALAILAIWRDKESLPQIAQFIKGNQRGVRAEAMAAYLTIEGGPESTTLLLSQLKKGGSFENDVLLRAVMLADITDERRLELLQRASFIINDPHAVPAALRRGDQEEVAALLAPLMDAETDLRLLGGYAEVAAGDKQKRFGKQVAKAVHALAVAAKAPDPRDDEFDYAAESILLAAVAYELKGIDADLAALTTCDRPAIQITAIATKIRLGGPLDDGLKKLISRLSDDDPALRQAALKGLAGLKVSDDTQRQKVESLLLPLLNGPAESSAIRLLAKFGGDETAKRLLPMLDDPSMPRSLLAAWALAHIDKPAARDAGLRRIAIHAFFHHQQYQQGNGIDFPISDDIGFHQTTVRLNPGAYIDHDQAVRLPDELLRPFPLSAAEQEYAVRVYRHTLLEGRGPLQDSAIEVFPSGKIDASYLPLMRTIAKEDAGLRAVFVNGKQVAVFETRKLAAMHVARITDKPATYIGLTGEEIDSLQLPAQPYKDQAALVAGFALDYVTKGLTQSDPQSSRDWDEIERRQLYLRIVVESFGPELKSALVAEAARRDPAGGMKHLRVLESWKKDKE